MKLLSFLLPTTSECRNREAPGDFAAGAGGTVASSRAAISSLGSFPGKLPSGPCPSQQRVSVCHVPPCLSFPRFGSRNGPYVNPALSPKRILFQHTFPIPGRPRGGTKQTKRARKKLPKPEPKGDGKRPPATRAKDPETAGEARREYEQARNRTPERREYRRRYAEEQRQRAKLLGKCQKCSKPAIPRQTRCPTCAEAHRQSRRRSYAERRGSTTPVQD